MLVAMTTITVPEATPEPDAGPTPARRAERRPTAAPGRLSRFVRGRPGDAGWVRPAVLGLLAATAVLYLWGLGASGWANTYYSAAVQAGTKSWKAFFFGSSDASNFITVDKPPASLWVMELSARIFGVNSWSILVPAGARGRGRGRRALRDGAALVLARRRAASPARCWRSRRSPR